jgi:hypothetical protein
VARRATAYEIGMYIRNTYVGLLRMGPCEGHLLVGRRRLALTPIQIEVSESLADEGRLLESFKDQA